MYVYNFVSIEVIDFDNAPMVTLTIKVFWALAAKIRV